MNQTKLLLILALILGILIISACAPKPAQPIPSAAPASTVMVQPEVSTSLPAESTPLVTVQTATDIPTQPPNGGIVQVAPDTPPGPSVGGEKTVTLDDRGKTVSLAVGENFLLQLGEAYTWDISLSDEGVISRVKNITVIKGAQGVYTALKPGTATLTATGDPLCRQSKPACGMPSILFEVTIDVK